MRVLNGYFERMSRTITEHRGHISTFVGDGILALFGALQPNPWQANDAAHAALAMREALAAYNRELEAQRLPTLAFGVGLHRGVGVAGLAGADLRCRARFESGVQPLPDGHALSGVSADGPLACPDRLLR